jgi:tripartite-type tricarboxylate transporter receptor subunit TctC
VTTRQVLRGLLALLIAAPPLLAAAADFPIANKPIRLVVGFPAGGGTDLQARTVAQHLAPLLGVPVIVDNRPGAGTMLAAMEVVRSAPDGHTLMYTPASTLSQLPHTLATVKYDTFKDFTPVAQGALGPLVLVLHKSIPATSVKELVTYAKAHAGQLNYVSQGVGTPAHIFGQMFARQAGIDIVHVPYKGANDVAKDFVAGRVHLQFASSSAAVALARSGEVRMIAPQCAVPRPADDERTRHQWRRHRKLDRLRRPGRPRPQDHRPACRGHCAGAGDAQGARRVPQRRRGRCLARAAGLCARHPRVVPAVGEGAGRDQLHEGVSRARVCCDGASGRSVGGVAYSCPCAPPGSGPPTR